MLIRCLLVFVYLIHSTGGKEFKKSIPFTIQHLGFSLRCFSDTSLKEAERCEQRKGFRSCFIKYRGKGSLQKKTEYFMTSCQRVGR